MCSSDLGWLRLGETVWRADGSGFAAVALPEPPLTAPLLRGDRALWLTASELVLTDGAAVRASIRHGLAAGPRRTLVTALVEDSLFEASIQPAIALFAHLLWDPDTPEPELIRRAFSAYYREMEG